jgi:hypothetical protein
VFLSGGPVDEDQRDVDLRDAQGAQAGHGNVQHNYFYGALSSGEAGPRRDASKVGCAFLVLLLAMFIAGWIVFAVGGGDVEKSGVALAGVAMAGTSALLVLITGITREWRSTFPPRA